MHNGRFSSHFLEQLIDKVKRIYRRRENSAESGRLADDERANYRLSGVYSSILFKSI
jgi:hypothetical protein